MPTQISSTNHLWTSILVGPFAFAHISYTSVSRPQCCFYVLMIMIFNVMCLMQDEVNSAPLITMKKRRLQETRARLYHCDIVTVPINITNFHWTGIVFSWKLKYISYYDSYHKSGKRYINALQNFLIKYMPEENVLVTWDDWNIVYQSNETPHQSNGYDCGVFWLWTIRCIFLVSKKHRHPAPT